MAKVFLGVEHGGNDPGAVGYIKEADVNLNMALACKDYLTSYGVKVGISRTKDENDPVTDEIKECNIFNPDLAIDIHNNSGGGNGCEVYHSIYMGKSKLLDENINKELMNIDQNSRGIKTRKNTAGNDYYGFIRSTKAPAVIVESVFVDNAADAAQADTLSEQKMFGVAIAKGILKTLGISGVKPPLQNGSKPNKKLSIGNKVKIKKSASKYCTGQTIPNYIKGKTYTVQQIGTRKYPNGVLLKEIMSWVNKSDLK